MNYVFFAAASVAFVISYFLGKWVRSFWSLFVVPFVAAVVSVPSVWILLRFAELERFGLGIIAIVPVLIMFISIFTLAASFFGVLIGVLHAKSKNKSMRASKSV